MKISKYTGKWRELYKAEHPFRIYNESFALFSCISRLSILEGIWSHADGELTFMERLWYTPGARLSTARRPCSLHVLLFTNC